MRIVLLAMFTLGPAAVAGAHTIGDQREPWLAIVHQLCALHHVPLTIVAVAAAWIGVVCLRQRGRAKSRRS